MGLFDRAGGGRGGSPDLWAGAKGSIDGMPLFGRVRTARPTAFTDYPCAIWIRWVYDGSGQDGLPDDVTRQAMTDCEQALDVLDEGEVGYLMASRVGAGQREWLWYIADRDRFLRALNQLLPQDPGYPLDIEAQDDSTWDEYRSFCELLKPA